VNDYIHHRELREQQILAAMRRHAAEAPAQLGLLSSWRIMQLIYTKPFPFVLKMAAQHNVLKHLSKLESDGLIVNSSRLAVATGSRTGLYGGVDLDLWCVAE
jgi:hypothetical protein